MSTAVSPDDELNDHGALSERTTTDRAGQADRTADAERTQRADKPGDSGATEEDSKTSLKPIVGAVIGLALAVVLMLLAFVAPAVKSGAHDLPLTISGPAPAADKVAAAIEAKRPGAFEITEVATSQEATERIKHRDAIGAISLGRDGTTIQTASAAGAPYLNLLNGIGTGLRAQGQKVTMVDVAPYTKDDPLGSGLNGLALPFAFGGMASAAVLSNLIKGGTHRSRTARRTISSIAFSVFAGLAAAAVLRYGFHTIDGNYWMEALVFMLGVAGISLTVLGLESIFGYLGLGLGGVFMIFVANPLSGMSTGSAWLPKPWGEIGQLFPIGAAGTAIRSLGFFDGHGMQQALIVLACWVLFGLLLTRVSAMRNKRQNAAA